MNEEQARIENTFQVILSFINRIEKENNTHISDEILDEIRYMRDKALESC